MSNIYLFVFKHGRANADQMFEVGAEVESIATQKELGARGVVQLESPHVFTVLKEKC